MRKKIYFLRPRISPYLYICQKFTASFEFFLKFGPHLAPQSFEDDEAPAALAAKAKKSRKPTKPKVTLHCPIDGCGRSFCKESALQNHIQRHNRLFKCNHCDKTFTEQAKVLSGNIIVPGGSNCDRHKVIIVDFCQNSVFSKKGALYKVQMCKRAL